jgi:hypothetical protein
MIRFALVSAFFLTFSFSAFSQMITVSSERDQDGNVLISSANSDVIPYTLLMNFSGLQNLSSGASTVISNPGVSRVATLKRINANQVTNYSYTYTYVKGNIFAKSKIDPVYLIPLPEGVLVEAHQMKNLETTYSDKNASPYVGVSFKFSEPTSILAPRKGIISVIEMDSNIENKNLTFSAKENMIEIYHEDGTFTRISVLKSGSQRVKIGQTVLPGEVLAESGGENYDQGRHVRVVNYRFEKETSEKFKTVVFPVSYAIEKGTEMDFRGQKINVVHPVEVIELEMTKKELKNHQKGN